MGGCRTCPAASAVAAAVALAVASGGCGAAGTSGPGGGRELFAHACGACHTLNGADSPSHQGGDLLDVRLPRPVMLQFAHEMPTHPALTAAQLASVTDFILAAQRGR